MGRLRARGSASRPRGAAPDRREGHPETSGGLVDRQSQRAAQLTGVEAAALSAVSSGRPFRSRDLTDALGTDASARSRVIGALLERDLIARLHPGGRIYRLRLTPNALTPFVFAELDSMGSLPTIIRDDAPLQRPHTDRA